MAAYDHIVEKDVNIKGRGNSTWYQLPKKPYGIMFNEKVSLLREAQDKSWVLLANYSDKSSLRNHLAFYLSSISNLEYTPSSHFVELMLNGRYNGTYQLVDKLKISENRVNVGKDGFLFEIEARIVTEPDKEPDARYFTTPHLRFPVDIKDPDVEYGDENYNYAKSFVNLADSVLYSPLFMDSKEGWQKYMDMDSFVDWYLIHEIAKNNDSQFMSSCYMNLKRGGKLKMGPVWDFDIAFGNVDRNGNDNYEGFFIKNATWFTRLFEDPTFVKRVKERFSFFYDNREDMMREINEMSQYLRLSAIENDKKWNTLYVVTWSNNQIWGNYYNEVQCLKTWLYNRMDWLKVEFYKM